MIGLYYYSRYLIGWTCYRASIVLKTLTYADPYDIRYTETLVRPEVVTRTKIFAANVCHQHPLGCDLLHFSGSRSLADETSIIKWE